MGDLQVSLPQPNSPSANESPSPLPSPLQLSTPHPLAIGADSWRRAEKITQNIIWRIQPTNFSEERRREVVEYVQNLIKGFIGCVVFPFGSVPLKTYLPHGDIDLTAFGPPNSEGSLANDVRAVLEGEEQNKAAEFEVKDVQYIHAEVKLVKCLVQNIVVDISFNQIGGLCTVCFLEQVDHLIGKDHLFKRSIILIKAWCYYESRILGAHHGLISTYALETLVLYIFHFFHSSLEGPLAVLYRFLDYFGKFDWDKYCISLRGPVSISSLPEIVAEAPETDGGDLLLSPEFFKRCEESFSVPPRGLESNSNSRTFYAKHLNIVDPLKENNNLGRSVSKGSFYRIRSAFTYGARKLGKILLLPGESIANELNKFFMNTLDRHGSGERPDMQACSSFTDSTVSDANGSGSLDSNGGQCEDIDSIRISGLAKEYETGIQLGRQSCNHQLTGNCLHRCTKAESDGLSEGNVVSGMRLVGDAKDLATSRVTNGIHKLSPTSSKVGKIHCTPHLFFCQENGKVGSGNPDQLKTTKSGASMNAVNSARPLTSDEDIRLVSGKESYGAESSSNKVPQLCSNHRILASANPKDAPLISSQSARSSGNSNLTDCSSARNKGVQESGSNERDLMATSECPEAYGLSELSGDLELHFSNLLYAQNMFYDHVSGPTVPMQPPSPQFQNNSWDAFHQGTIFPPMNANGMVPRPPFSPAHGYMHMNPPFISGSYGMEDIPKPRGTGTYFPNTNYQQYRGRRQVSRPRSNGRAVTPPEQNWTDKGVQEPSPRASTPGFNANGRGRPPLLELPQAPAVASSGFPVANGFTFPPEGRLEFGSFGPIQVGASSTELDRQLDSGGPHSQGYAAILISSPEQRPGTSSNGRVTQLYCLDEDDFPPLSEPKK